MRVYAFTIPGELPAIVCAHEYTEAVGMLRKAGIHDFYFDQSQTWQVEQPLPHRLRRRR